MDIMKWWHGSSTAENFEEKAMAMVKESNKALAIPRPKIVIALDEMQTMAAAIAKSGMFGLRDEAQALSLMLLCQAEGLHPVLAVRRYHIIDGKPSMRADALQGEFEQSGAILWHERTETECAATFFRDKRHVVPERGLMRYRKLKSGQSISELAVIGEITIIRTMVDAIEKKLALSWKDEKWQMKKNWKQSPRQMLHARCLSEGVRAVAPGLVAGIYTEDEALDYLPEIDGSPDNGNDAERRVKEATANRIAMVTPFPVAGVEMDGFQQEKNLDPVTEENFNDVICHIGKAEGNMLGKAVRDIHPSVLVWLKNHFGDGEGIRWGNPPTEKDTRLKTAVDLALSKL